MKRHLNLILALSALLFGAGCKKDAARTLSPVTAADPTTIGNFQLNNVTGRNIAYDQNDGSGRSCILSYDISSNTVSVTKVVGTTVTNVWSTSGLVTDGGTINVNTYASSDQYNEVGGVHIIAYDATASGHKDYLIVYVPGQGIVYVLAPTATPGSWHLVSSSGSGIAGYDLKSVYDKIITFEYNGTGPETGLICYRPGSGNCWVIENQSTSGTPNWLAVVKGSGGIGGFDLKGTTDQIVAVDYNPSLGQQNLVVYRPLYGYIWYLNHSSGSTTFTAQYSTHSGFPDFTCMHQGDRIIAYDANGSSEQNYLLCYSPGTASATVINGISTGDPIGSTFAYPMNLNPYSPLTYKGDKLIGFTGNGSFWGYSTLIGYQNGTGLAQIYDLTSTGSYTRAY